MSKITLEKQDICEVLLYSYQEFFYTYTMSEGTPLPPPPPRKPEQRFAPANDRPNPTERDKDFDGPPPPPGGGRRKKKKKKGQ